jgi:hypothetical protein
MALEECRECCEQVSTEARACPHCGCPWPTVSSEHQSSQESPIERTMRIALLVVSLLALVGYIRDPEVRSTTLGAAVVATFFISARRARGETVPLWHGILASMAGGAATSLWARGDWAGGAGIGFMVGIGITLLLEMIGPHLDEGSERESPDAEKT